MFKLLPSLLVMILLAGVAEAQCSGGNCSLFSSVRSKTTVRTTTRTQTVASPVTVVQAPVVVQSAPVTTSSTTVQVRQRIRRR